MAEDWLAAFIAAEGLPEGFRRTAALVCEPLAALAAAARAELGRTVVIGVCGAQGSGKSTIAAATARILCDRGRRTAVLSLDDLYLSREARADLARAVHPLLQTRGPPGTHDVGRGTQVLARLAQDGPVELPRFDKARDEPRPHGDWPVFEGPADVVLFEGWCVGAIPQPTAALAAPVNALEREEDPDGRWRRFVNAALGHEYRPLFAGLDRLVLLKSPSFEAVADWRGEQEAKLRARTGTGMRPDEIPRFVAHYERLTRWILQEMPGRADWTVPLARDRSPLPG